MRVCNLADRQCDAYDRQRKVLLLRHDNICLECGKRLTAKNSVLVKAEGLKGWSGRDLIYLDCRRKGL